MKQMKWLATGKSVFSKRHALALSAALMAAGLGLSGCAETQLIAQGVKTLSNDSDSSSGQYKVGKPYQISGVWYYPQEDWSYVETGIASWYGEEFHGKPTANGEVFDMNVVSAAHRTLPLSSIVQVTNLENGRSIRVRVNDRGPFARNRILDMSRRGAQLLGYELQGTAKVRVEILKDESLALKESMTSKVASAGNTISAQPTPTPSVQAETISLPVRPEAPKNVSEPEVVSAPVTQQASIAPPVQAQSAPAAVSPTSIYVQVGAYSRYENALKVKARLSNAGDIDISKIRVGGRDLYRVRVGPIFDVAQADGKLEEVIRSGIRDAKIVVEQNANAKPGS